MYKATVNSNQFDIVLDKDAIIINDLRLDWDVVEITDGYFHILHNNNSYKAEIVKIDTATSTFTLKINGRIYTVNLKSKFDLLLEKMGMTNSTAGKVNSIKAPMPGLIIDLRVKEGDEVKAGDTLIILEAMKMENSIKSPGEGVVKKVSVKKGDSVEKGQLLISF
jgi:biotin carboxyl carrier protein